MESITTETTTEGPPDEFHDSLEPERRLEPNAATRATAAAAAAIATGAWFSLSGAETSNASPNSATQHAVEGLVERGFPAALAAVTATGGKITGYAAGVADRDTGKAADADGYVRIGSNTKTYTVVVVLQLVEEGLIELDAPIDTYLPGLVHGEGIDGSVITVGSCCNTPLGFPSTPKLWRATSSGFRDVYTSPRDLRDAALETPGPFAPGERWEYINTGYIVLGLLVERVTQRPLFEQVNERIVERLGLEETYFPGVGERKIRGEHPKGYHTDATGKLVGISALDPSWGWSAGQVVPTPADLNRFMRGIRRRPRCNGRRHRTAVDDHRRR
ncbi:serine hydrolase domain-containing protein [Agromyces neolithicus]|uniref:Beta-lactamase-related domain-containing protein n=1 Tax=Agromyces neolithicus TaxID=269420 RepID=A0ABN2M9L1_9MICO